MLSTCIVELGGRFIYLFKYTCVSLILKFFFEIMSWRLQEAVNFIQILHFNLGVSLDSLRSMFLIIHVLESSESMVMGTLLEWLVIGIYSFIYCIVYRYRSLWTISVKHILRRIPRLIVTNCKARVEIGYSRSLKSVVEIISANIIYWKLWLLSTMLYSSVHLAFFANFKGLITLVRRTSKLTFPLLISNNLQWYVNYLPLRCIIILMIV